MPVHSYPAKRSSSPHQFSKLGYVECPRMSSRFRFTKVLVDCCHFLPEPSLSLLQSSMYLFFGAWNCLRECSLWCTYLLERQNVSSIGWINEASFAHLCSYMLIIESSLLIIALWLPHHCPPPRALVPTAGLDCHGSQISAAAGK